MLKIAVAEDNQDDLKKLLGYLSQYQEEQQIEMAVDSFPDGVSILENYHSKWDIIFLDIEMPNIDGFHVAKEIRAMDTSVILIFITNMARYAIRGYEVEALDFVLKPISYEQFYMKMQKASTIAKLREQNYIFLSAKDGDVRIGINEIIYVEVINHHLHIITLDGKFIVYSSLKSFEDQLPTKMFARCGQSYLINLHHVRKVGQAFVLVDQHTIPISRSKRKNFVQAVSDYFGGGMR